MAGITVTEFPATGAMVALEITEAGVEFDGETREVVAFEIAVASVEFDGATGAFMTLEITGA